MRNPLTFSRPVVFKVRSLDSCVAPLRVGTATCISAAVQGELRLPSASQSLFFLFLLDLAHNSKILKYDRFVNSYHCMYSATHPPFTFKH